MKLKFLFAFFMMAAWTYAQEIQAVEDSIHHEETLAMEAQRMAQNSESEFSTFVNPEVGTEGIETTCANAQTIASNTIGFTNQNLVCGTSNDLNSTTVPGPWADTVNGGDLLSEYGNGLEALYKYSPSATKRITITVKDTSWTAIMVFKGCPSSGGQYIAGTRGTGTTRTLSFNAFQGNEYYIWIDTWPSPASPCVEGGKMDFSVSNIPSSIEYTTAGTHNFTTHPSSTKVKVEAIGGGGAGGYVKATRKKSGIFWNNSYVASGGGGGGAYAEGTVNVLGDTSYTVTVGSGGTSNASVQNNGGDSSFYGKNETNFIVLAKGGTTASKVQPSAGDDVGGDGGNGGSKNDSKGNISVFAGGNGGNGKLFSGTTTDHTSTGSGGAGAYKQTGSNGADGLKQNSAQGGTGNDKGGNGGNGIHRHDTFVGVIGNPGKTNGGGGSGSIAVSSGSSGGETLTANGASGASGYVKINYITIENISNTGTDECAPTLPIVVKGVGYSQDSNSITSVKINGTTVAYTRDNDNQITITDLNGAITPLGGSPIVIESANGDAKSSALIKNNSREFIANNGNWSVADSWKSGLIPDANSCVRIPSGKKVTVNTTSAVAKNVTVENGGELVIAANQALTVTDYVKNNHTADKFLIKDGASLIQKNALAANSGEIQVEKTFNFSAGRQQYNFVSVPTIGYNVKNIYPGTTYTLTYNEKTDYFVNNNGDYLAGRGYAIKEATGTGVTTIQGKFEGAPFNGDTSVELKKEGQGYNLVGNPYPSTLDLVQVYNDNKTALDATNGSTFQIWDNRGNTLFEQLGQGYANYETNHYATFNASTSTGVKAQNASGSEKKPSRYLRPGTAFLVQAKSNGYLNFNNDQRKHDISVAFTGKNVQSIETDFNTMDEFNPTFDRFWLNMETPDAIELSSAMVYFDEGDNGYGLDDSEAYNSSDEVYYLIGDKKAIIQGKSAFTVHDVVPMGYRAFKRGTYKLYIYEQEGIFEAGQKIYLKDKQMNVTHDLSQGAYEFKSNAGEFNNRFEIVYKKGNKASGDVLHRNEISVQKNNRQIEVNSSLDKLVSVEIYALDGRLLYKDLNVNSKEWHISVDKFNKEIIFVKIFTEKGELVTKKLVNK